MEVTTMVKLTLRILLNLLIVMLFYGAIAYLCLGDSPY